MISGWRVSGLVLYASGAPLSFSSSNYYYYPFNRHSFNNPDTSLTSPTFGYVTSVNSTPRQGQFGARFEW